jgi:hypothetical protein
LHPDGVCSYPASGILSRSVLFKHINLSFTPVIDYCYMSVGSFGSTDDISLHKILHSWDPFPRLIENLVFIRPYLFGVPALDKFYSEHFKAIILEEIRALVFIFFVNIDTFTEHTLFVVYIWPAIHYIYSEQIK